MQNRRRQTEATLLAIERRQREDDAPRLKHEVHRLAELNLVIDEYQPGSVVLVARHTRRIVIDRAPAMFEMPCTEDRCRGGGFDLTHDVMRALRSRQTEFEGQDTCAGELGAGRCGRILHYVAHAKYSDESP